MKRLGLAAGLAVGLSGAVLAHSGATGIVKERMDAMEALAASMKGLVGMVRSGDIDAARAEDFAGTIKAHSGAALLALYPEGSLQPVSEASPEIWEDWEQFASIAQELDTLAGDLAAAAETNAEARIAEVTRDVAGTCSSCHKSFRINK